MNSSLKSGCVVLLICLFASISFSGDIPDPLKPKEPPPGHALKQPSQNTPVAESDMPFPELLKSCLLRYLPENIVIEDNHNWGHQVPDLTLHGTKVVQVMRNHGTWEKMKTVCLDLPHRLKIYVREPLVLSSPMPLNVQFYVPATVYLEEKIWQDGMQIFGGHGRARFRFKIVLDFETALPSDAAGKNGGDSASGLKLKGVKVFCGDFVGENLDGLGGDFARKIARANLHRGFQEWQPALERNMEEKVRLAVLKAAEEAELTAGAAKLTQVIANRIAAQSKPIRSPQLQPSEVQIIPVTPSPMSASSLQPWTDILNISLDSWKVNTPPSNTIVHSGQSVLPVHASPANEPIHSIQPAYPANEHTTSAHSSNSNSTDHILKVLIPCFEILFFHVPKKLCELTINEPSKRK